MSQLLIPLHLLHPLINPPMRHVMIQTIWEYFVLLVVAGIIIPALNHPIETIGSLVTLVAFMILTEEYGWRLWKFW